MASERRKGLDRVLFLLTDADAGERFQRVLGDLVNAGVGACTLLHMLEPDREGADPFLEEVSTWARRFEASGIRKVSVALKRGDPAAWVRALSAIAPGQWVIAAAPRAVPEGFLRPASPWRNLPVPVLLLPDRRQAPPPPLFGHVLVALKAPEKERKELQHLVEALPQAGSWRALHVRTDRCERLPRDWVIPCRVISGDRYDIADNLLSATGEGVSLLVMFARPEGTDPALPAGYVIEAVVRGTEIPVLLWPGTPETARPTGQA